MKVNKNKGCFGRAGTKRVQSVSQMAKIAGKFQQDKNIVKNRVFPFLEMIASKDQDLTFRAEATTILNELVNI